MSRQLARIEGGQDAVISYMRQLQYGGFRNPIILSDSTEIQPYQYQQQVPAEVAKHFSSQHLGKVKIPFDLECELERSCRQAGLKGRKLRTVATDLIKKLRKISRTLARGGIQDKPSKLIEMRKHLKYKNPVTNMVVYNLMKAGYTPSASQTVSQVARAASDFVDVTTKKHQNLTPEYEQQESLAYTAVRSPACYAAIFRVMKEIRQRYPSFCPSRMLDFGCGPGTAVWAAQEVWGAALDDVVAVDHADDMLTIGNTVQKRRSERGQWTPRIRWVMQIPGLSKYNYFPTIKRKYNLVVAAYVFGEISNQYERDWLVRSLWSQCSDMMIVMEPGTPVGSRLVRDIRAMILKEENKRAEKQTGASKKGVHVVAPCPHDGPCPMDKNKHWWCHFNQRFERTLVQRICKIRPGHGKARDYQDERYSYVVLRRGQRPNVEDVSIDAQFVMDETEDVEYAVVPGKVVNKLERAGKIMSVEEIFPNVREEEVAEEDDELVAMNLLMKRMSAMAIEGSENKNNENLLSSGEDLNKEEIRILRQNLHSNDLQQQTSLNHQQISDDQNEEEIFTNEVLGEDDESVAKNLLSKWMSNENNTDDNDKQLRSSQNSHSNDQQQQQQLPHFNGEQIDDDLNEDKVAKQNQSSNLNVLQSDENLNQNQYNNYQNKQSLQQNDDTQLTNNQTVLQNDKQISNSLGEQSTTKQFMHQQFLYKQQKKLQNINGNDQIIQKQKNTNKEILDDQNEDQNDLETSDFRWVDWHQEDPESVQAAGSACSRWGRLLRPPIKEYRKVVMHVCAPQGELEKRIITRLDSKKYWFGKAGYRMARKARWGDLWPTFYNGSDIIVQLGQKKYQGYEQNEDSLDGSQFGVEGEERE